MAKGDVANSLKHLEYANQYDPMTFNIKDIYESKEWVQKQWWFQQYENMYAPIFKDTFFKVYKEIGIKHLETKNKYNSIIFGTIR